MEIETPQAKLRNALSPLYGLASAVLAIEKNPDMKDIIIDMAKQAISNKETIDKLLLELETEKWLPMDTAPKDRKILVCDKNEGIMWVEWGQRDRLERPARFGWCVPGTEQDEQGGSWEAMFPIAWAEVPKYLEITQNTSVQEKEIEYPLDYIKSLFDTFRVEKGMYKLYSSEDIRTWVDEKVKHYKSKTE